LLDGLIATSVLPDLVGAIVGATGISVGVWLTAYYTKKLDVVRRREGLVSEAFSDLVAALARSAFATSGMERIEALALAASAKAQLVTYGDASMVDQIRRFDEHGADASKPECQAAIVAIAQGLRAANAAPGQPSDDEVRQVLFGKTAPVGGGYGR
jgi:hypothetical protein